MSLPHPEEGRLLESTAVTLRIWAAQPQQLELPQFAFSLIEIVGVLRSERVSLFTSRLISRCVVGQMLIFLKAEVPEYPALNLNFWF